MVLIEIETITLTNKVPISAYHDDVNKHEVNKHITTEIHYK